MNPTKLKLFNKLLFDLFMFNTETWIRRKTFKVRVYKKNKKYAQLNFTFKEFNNINNVELMERIIREVIK